MLVGEHHLVLQSIFWMGEHQKSLFHHDYSNGHNFDPWFYLFTLQIYQNCMLHQNFSNYVKITLWNQNFHPQTLPWLKLLRTPWEPNFTMWMCLPIIGVVPKLPSHTFSSPWVYVWGMTCIGLIPNPFPFLCPKPWSQAQV